MASTKVLRYLKASPARGILFLASCTLKLYSFPDSDSERCINTRKPIIGYCVILGHSLLFWQKIKSGL